MSRVALVVDDNALNVELIRFLLEAAGWTVHAAADAATTLERLERIEPDVVLMDLGLPGVSGLDLTRHIKADPRRRAIPIIAVTAAAMKGDEERARRAGCDGYISKPIDTRRFLRQVEDVLAARPEGGGA